jgi:hypothetical protein
MYARAGRHHHARLPLGAAIGQFQQIGMTGWLRRAELLATLLP